MPPAGDQEQGLFVCVPVGNADLSGLAEDAGALVMPPGPLLAGITSVVAGGDGAGLAGVSEGFLFSVMSAGRRMSSCGTWLELSAMHELALRHPAPQDPPGRRARPGPGPASTGSGGTGSAGAGSAGAGSAGHGSPGAGVR